MQKISLAIIISLFSMPSLACECHGSGQVAGAFGSFARWQLPNSGCIPAHSLESAVTSDASVIEEPSDAVAEEKQAMESEAAVPDISMEPALETSS